MALPIEDIPVVICEHHSILIRRNNFIAGDTAVLLTCREQCCKIRCPSIEGESQAELVDRSIHI